MLRIPDPLLAPAGCGSGDAGARTYVDGMDENTLLKEVQVLHELRSRVPGGLGATRLENVQRLCGRQSELTSQAGNAWNACSGSPA